MHRKTTSVSHNGAIYDLNIGVWLKQRNSAPLETFRNIVTEDIRLPNNLTAGIYKDEKKVEYDALPDSSFSSAKKYLNNCSQRDFGFAWDELISGIKQLINKRCAPLLLAQHELSLPELHEIKRAAINGHVGATYWIGTALRDKNNKECLRWLAMAHNRGHIGACYEMAVYLTANGNHIDALRCLIVSADGGLDLAFLNIFDLSILIDLFKINQLSPLETMLDELVATPYSTARYIKGILLLLQGRLSEGLSLLDTFGKFPGKKLAEEEIDILHERRNKVIADFVSGLVADISSGMQPLDAISFRGKQAGLFNFEDYCELVSAVKNMRLSE